MKKILLIISILLITQATHSAPPTRSFVYTAGETILSNEVTTNEDSIFNYLQGGVDTIKDGTIVNDDISVSANIQSDKLNLTSIQQNIANTGTFTNTGNVTVTGTLNATTVQQGGASIAIPQGVIVMWSGAISAIPTGWELCDGSCTISCPDLTDRFVIHADADSGGTRDVGDTGGTHSVTLSEANLASHQHISGGATNTGGAVYGTSTDNTSAGQFVEYTDSGSLEGPEVRALTSSVGSGTAVNTIPKFYALAYIIKN